MRQSYTTAVTATAVAVIVTVDMHHGTTMIFVWKLDRR